MIKRYCAGAYSSDNVFGVFENVRKGLEMSTELFARGYAVFCPFTDFHFCLMKKPEHNFTLEMFYNYSIAWLEVSDVMIVLPGYENSVGTLKEIEIANEKGIPIFYTLKDLEIYRIAVH